MRILNKRGIPVIKISRFVLLAWMGCIMLTGCTSEKSTSDPNQANTQQEANHEKITKLENELEKKKQELIKLEDQLLESEKALTKLKQILNETGDKGADATKSGNILSVALEIMKLIEAADFKALSSYIHPAKGVRFTPYFYVDPEVDQVFSVAETAELMEDTQVINWGVFDGSGEPMELTFSDYYDQFIYDADFMNADMIGNNVALGEGNTIDNVAEAYPDGQFIEFHFPQIDPQFGGIDWRSLRLIFEETNNELHLVGIVHGEWTI